MRIGILGSGNVGRALTKGFLAEGHEVWLATRKPDGDKATLLRDEHPGVQVADFEAVAKHCELAILATPWEAATDMLKLAGPHHLDYKTVIDTNNAIRSHKDGVEQVVELSNSAGEVIQYLLPRSHVVKCFNTTGANNFYKPQFDSQPTMFLCGDNEEAKQQVSELVRTFGWEPLDAGGIAAARQLEAMAVVWINHAIHSGERHHAFKMLA
jgi:predicted dinucleotide-binding enzyme